MCRGFRSSPQQQRHRIRAKSGFGDTQLINRLNKAVCERNATSRRRAGWIDQTRIHNKQPSTSLMSFAEASCCSGYASKHQDPLLSDCIVHDQPRSSQFRLFGQFWLSHNGMQSHRPENRLSNFSTNGRSPSRIQWTLFNNLHRPVTLWDSTPGTTPTDMTSNERQSRGIPEDGLSVCESSRSKRQY